MTFHILTSIQKALRRASRKTREHYHHLLPSHPVAVLHNFILMVFQDNKPSLPLPCLLLAIVTAFSTSQIIAAPPGTLSLWYEQPAAGRTLINEALPIGN